ncbi:MAG: hypothetical protein DMG25_11420 [Acidobacteria bacterium]|nr:MAG: hypothetical protein DMG25_11420 [Acidobacteriota bacterium]
MKLTPGKWASLSFARDGTVVSVEKPESVEKFYVSPDIEAKYFRSMAAEELAVTAFFTKISLHLPSLTAPVPQEKRQDILMLTLSVLSDLKAWIRVLTGQYWVGYKERPFLEDSHTIAEVAPSSQRPIRHGKTGTAFEYGRPLDEVKWAEIGRRLERKERPRPSQLFFCDGLLDVLEDDLEQAVLALGVACEIEIQSLLDELVSRKPEELQKIFADTRFTFGVRVARTIKHLGGTPFGEFDQDAAQLVDKLYKMRGAAAHRGECVYEQRGKLVRLNRSTIGKFIHAVEKFFEWSEIQRASLL